MRRILVVFCLSTLAVTSACAAPAPVAHWRLNEGTGTVAEDVVGSNDGSLIDTAAWTNGVEGTAVRITNGNSKVTVSHAALLDVTNSFSLVASIRAEANASFTNSVRFFTKGSYSSGWSLMLQTNFQLVVQATASTGNSLGSLGSISTGRWSHVVGTFDKTSGIARIYVNGILENQAVWTGARAANTNKVTIGTLGDSIKATIDDCRVFDVALTESQAIQLSLENDKDLDKLVDVDEAIYGTSITNANTDGTDAFLDGAEVRFGTDPTSGTSYPNLTNSLKGFWKLSEGSGTSTADASGQGNTGTLAGGPTWVTSGVLSNALFFDGVDDQVTCGVGGSGSPLAVTNVTVSVWAYVTNKVQDSRLVTRKNSSGAGYMVSWENPYNRVTLNMPSVPVVPVSLSEISENRWHNLAFSYGSGTVKAYLDGNLRATGTYTNALGSSS